MWREEEDRDEDKWLGETRIMKDRTENWEDIDEDRNTDSDIYV